MTIRSNVKWWHAQIFLGRKAIWHYLIKLWPWRTPHGLLQFKQNYIDDGILPLTRNQRKLAHEPGRCTGCGQCDMACPALSSEFSGPMRFVIRHSLSVKTPEPLLDICDRCGLCEKSCPEQIPILELARAHLHSTVDVK